MTPDLQETNHIALRCDRLVIAKYFPTSQAVSTAVLRNGVFWQTDNLTNCGPKEETLQTSSELLPGCFPYCRFAVQRPSREPIQDDVPTRCSRALYKCVILRRNGTSLVV